MATDNVDHSDRDHAEFGPSGLKPLNLCIAFKNRGGTSPAAERGTRIHEALEIDDYSELDEEDEIEGFLQCQKDRNEALEHLAELTGVGVTLHKELRLHIDLGCTSTFGTADIVAVSGPDALLLDYKLGISYIDTPPENWQSTAYAIGVFQAFPDVERIHAVFSIPARGELLEGDYTRADLPGMIERVGKLIVKAEFVRRMWDDGAPPLELCNPNPNCEYCEFKEQSRCPALGAMVFDVATRLDAGGALPANGTIEAKAINDPAVVAAMYPVATVVGSWAKTVMEQAKKLALGNGGQIPGYKIRSGGTPRKVTDAEALRNILVERGVSDEEILKSASFSLKSVAALVGTVAEKGKKSDLLREVEDQLEVAGAITKQAERLSLVAEL